jgi:hypothetical protein
VCAIADLFRLPTSTIALPSAYLIKERCKLDIKCKRTMFYPTDDENPIQKSCLKWASSNFVPWCMV